MNRQPVLSIVNRDSGELQQIRMDEETIVIGRDQDNYVVLDSKSISRNHAEIRFEDDTFFIVDLESGNGTYLNNQRLTPHEKVMLRSSDHIRIENFDIKFQMNGHESPDFAEITDTDILEIKMIKKLLRTIDKDNVPILEVVGGKATGQRFSLTGKTQEIVIGRDPACEFHIDEEMISRKHARVVKKWDTVTLLDLNSKNGIYINDERVTEKVLSDGDRILLGTLPLIFRNPAEQGLDFLSTEPPPRREPTRPAPVEGGEEISQPGARVARRSAIEEQQEAEPEPAPSPSTPQPEGAAHGTEMAMPPPEPPPPAEEPAAPFWQRFSPLELAGAAVGVIILLGSLWLLMKLL